MRNKRVILIAVIIIASFSSVPTAAYAAGGETGECLKELAAEIKSGEVTNETVIEARTEDCFSAPSPVVPAWNEVLWGGLAFAVVAFGLMKFGFPAVKKGLKAREDKIREDLASAESARQEAVAKSADYDAKLADARQEASRIIDEAKVHAGTVRADLVNKAEEEAAQIRAKAQADAESIKSRAMSDIQSQVAELSVDLAEKVVKNSLDKKAQIELVNGYIADLAKTSKN